MTQKTIQAEVVDLDSIQFDPDNPRLHDEDNLTLIESSIKDAGFARSIVVDENDQLIAGEGATRGAVAAGLTKALIIDIEGDEVVAVRRKNLSPEQKERLKFVDNRANELSSWDNRRLVKFLQDNPDQMVQVGFQDEDLKHLIEHLALQEHDLKSFFNVDTNHKQSDESGDPETFDLSFSFETQEVLDQVLDGLSKIAETPELALLSLLKL